MKPFLPVDNVKRFSLPLRLGESSASWNSCDRLARHRRQSDRMTKFAMHKSFGNARGKVGLEHIFGTSLFRQRGVVASSNTKTFPRERNPIVSNAKSMAGSPGLRGTSGQGTGRFRVKQDRAR